ncbi:hypothetical protein V8E55_007108 [Tylopilus felleus]
MKMRTRWMTLIQIDGLSAARLGDFLSLFAVLNVTSQSIIYRSCSQVRYLLELVHEIIYDTYPYHCPLRPSGCSPARTTGGRLGEDDSRALRSHCARAQAGSRRCRLNTSPSRLFFPRGARGVVCTARRR